MATNYSTSLRLALPVTGELNGTWGDVVNNQITSMVEQAVAGYQSIAITGDTTLSVANGTTDQSRNMMLKFTGTLAAGANIVVPTATKLYFIDNATTGGFVITVKTSAGTGVAVPAGYKAVVYCNGTNVVDAVSALSSLAVSGNTVLTGTLAVTGAVSGAGFSTYLASPPAIGGTTAAAGSFTTLSASSTVSGAGFSTYLASPPAIGGTAPAAGAFTTLSASSTVSGAGFTSLFSSPPAIGGTAPAAGTFTTLSATSDLSMTGSGKRITGDFSNATIANRVMFQTSTVNGASVVGVIPNGTGVGGIVEVLNNSAPANASYLRLSTDAGTQYIEAGKYGTGSYLPMTFYTGGSERMRIGTAGEIGLGGANYGTSGQVLTSNGSGTAPTWQAASSLPSQTGNSGKYLTTNGSAASWGALDFTSSLAASGYQKLPSGLIIQWGKSAAITNNVALAQTFAIAFPNACFSVSTALLIPSGFGASLDILSITTTGFSVITGNQSMNPTYATWIAIGY